MEIILFSRLVDGGYFEKSKPQNPPSPDLLVIRPVSELSLFCWRNIKRYLFFIRVFRYSVVVFYLSEYQNAVTHIYKLT